ncbi:hypothetical protein DM01DRAFT_1397126 [Hesseltinella vesiculosa]|uniref:Cupredoxin n=1 Tax=Hesseltinella vesiculosa TaxID=101127 RepID=A0A1X2G6I5_9FUNG|nr:hypothetical protein DM01DRAFT_1397126 [Hesseltinella vesiculosa]
MNLLFLPSIYSVTVLILFLCPQCVFSKLRIYDLDITRGQIDPDCSGVLSDVLMVNGQYPAPPLYATVNDEIRITVHNSMASNAPTTIHYHGILQIGTTESDGVPNVTQAPINPGEGFEQRFTLTNQSGTYYYHAHVDLQDDVIQGPFIIFPSENDWPMSSKEKLSDGRHQYDDERIIQLSEWWYQAPVDRQNYYLGTEYKGFIAADNYLVNGHGMAREPQGAICPGLTVLDVTPGKTYRFRVIGALTFSTVGYSIAEHKMTIIEVDGDLIEPYESDYLEISPGQRFSFLLKTDKHLNGSYNMDIRPFWITNTTGHGRAILSYDAISNSESSIFPLRTTMKPASDLTIPNFPSEKSQWAYPNMVPLNHVDGYDFAASPDRTIIILPEEKMTRTNTTRWLVNGHQMEHWSVPLLEQLRRRKLKRSNDTVLHLNRQGEWDGYDTFTKTYPMKYGEVIDFVIHTTTLINDGICAAHPWHSHGVKHFPIAYGNGKYNHNHDKNIRNYPHPIARDTTLVYPDQGRYNTSMVPCGWTKLRIFAVNPGLWAFHCHITGHMLQGMMIIMEMAPERITYLRT